jgi:hypothetical protein
MFKILRVMNRNVMNGGNNGLGGGCKDLLNDDLKQDEVNKIIRYSNNLGYPQ